MKISLILAEFETGFASSFQHTSRVQYNVVFDSSTIASILNNLDILKTKIMSGDKNNVHVRWQMNLEHVIMLERLLNEILDAYQKVFFFRPINEKIYDVNKKLRAWETPSPKDYAREVVSNIFKVDDKKQISSAEKKKRHAEELSTHRALKAINKVINKD
jgi:hypothetical protein